MGIGYTNTIETQRFSNEIPLAPIPDVRFARSVENGGISAFFQDPKDIYVDGQLITKRKETIIVAKKGAPPENHLDGEYIYTHTGYHDVQKWLEFIPSYSDYNGAGAQLYVQFFAISTSGNVYPITRVYKLYTYLYALQIEKDNPNPNTRVKPYLTSTINTPHPATPSEWESVEPFKSIRPCLLKGGKVQYYLNKENFTKKEDNSPADIENGFHGDVMIEFPNIAVDISPDGRVVISGIPPRASYHYFSPLEGLDSTDNFYVSAYLASDVQGVSVSSLAGKNIVKYSLSKARTIVQRKGGGYDLLPLWVHTAIQALFVLKYKTTNSDIIGYGKLYGMTEFVRTGETKMHPMDSGTTANTAQNIKLFGIEGLWGMQDTWLDGVFSDSPYIKVRRLRRGLTYNSFFNDGVGYPGYMKKFADRGLGFLPARGDNSSDSTYFCDYFHFRGTGEPLNNYFTVGNLLGGGIVKSSGIFSGRNVRESSQRAIRFVYY